MDRNIVIAGCSGTGKTDTLLRLALMEAYHSDNMVIYYATEEGRDAIYSRIHSICVEMGWDADLDEELSMFRRLEMFFDNDAYIRDNVYRLMDELEEEPNYYISFYVDGPSYIQNHAVFRRIDESELITARYVTNTLRRDSAEYIS